MFALEDRYWWFKSKRLFLQAALGTVDTRLPAGPRILDIGCGTGAVLEMLSSYGETHGIDVEKAALTFCTERNLGNLVQSSATALPYADDVFDLIVAADMLEHLRHDAPRGPRECPRAATGRHLPLYRTRAPGALW